MIAMVVGHELGVDAWELSDFERGRNETTQAGTDALREHRVDEQRHAVELDEPARVPEPGEARRLTDRGRVRELSDVRLDAGRGGGHVISATTAEHLIDDGPLDDCGQRLWTGAVEIHEAKATGSGLFQDILL